MCITSLLAHIVSTAQVPNVVGCFKSLSQNFDFSIIPDRDNLPTHSRSLGEIFFTQRMGLNASPLGEYDHDQSVSRIPFIGVN